MRVPESLVSLVELGIIEDVLRPLMSGKEAQVYLVVARGQQCVAKVYKEANDRTFKHRAEYTEGRQIRNSRDQRAIDKRSAYGRAQQEAAWRDVEAEVIYRLRDVGVRVPEPRDYVDRVLVMELVTDGAGKPAPRLADLTLPREQAEQLFEELIREVVKMLCAGLVHGDLSEFNILASRRGPVLIDFPQAVDASKNLNARKLLLRDVGNLTRFFGRFSRKLRNMRYGEEMWALYERGELTPDTVLTGTFKQSKKKADVASLLEEIQELEREDRERREALGLPPPRPARRPRPQAAEEPAPEPQAERRPERKGERSPDRKQDQKQDRKPERSRRRRKARSRPDAKPEPRLKPGSKPGSKPESMPRSKPSSPAAKPRRRRRRRRKPGNKDV